MVGRKTINAAKRLIPQPPQFRGRAFTDAGGKRRFGISLSVNGSRFNGSVLMRNARVDVGGVAQLLESMAAHVRRG